MEEQPNRLPDFMSHSGTPIDKKSQMCYSGCDIKKGKRPTIAPS